MHSNETSRDGLKMITIDVKKEMEVFDALHPSIRKAIANSPIKWSAISCLNLITTKQYSTNIMLEIINYRNSEIMKGK